MFFFLSKFLKFIISPLLWVISLLLLAMLTRDEYKRKKFLMWGFVLLLFFSSPLPFNLLMNLWETPISSYKDLQTYEAAIVMGGVLAYNEEKERIQFVRGADRLFQAIDLYKRGKIKKIIFSGGSGYVLRPEYKEGEKVKAYVIRLGIPGKDFLVENESRNTHENAVFTKQLLEKENINGKLLLITSGFHMRRSLACFHKQGIEPQPFAADRYVKDKNKSSPIDLEGLLMPSLEPLLNWTNFIHEIVGCLVYKMMGYA